MTDAVRRSLPNALTMLRLVLAAGFFAALNAYRYPDTHVLWANVAVWVFILAALTDWLDGYLARRWKATSVFGRIMDPFCDKVLIIGAFIYLAGPRFVVPEWVEEGSFFTMASGVYPWMVAVILARELLVTGFRGEVESSGGSFAAMQSGKWKMLLQSVTIPVVIFLAVNFKTHETLWAKWMCYVFVYATVIITILSGVPYVVRLRSVLPKRGAGEV
jgi:CDP-diacylglycerol--glycerol-3-phosphate 3-phosphatidyltransferase